MASSAERQRKFRAAKRDQGIKSVTVLLPAEHEADLREMAERLCEDRELEFGSLRNSRTRVFASRRG